MHTVYSPKEGDFVEVRKGLSLKRVIEGEDESFRAGYARFAPRDRSERILWMDEFLLCTRGRFEVAASDPPFYDKDATYELRPGDVLFQGRGSRIRLTCGGTEAGVMFYVAIPSSVKGTRHKLFPMSSDKLASLPIPIEER